MSLRRAFPTRDSEFFSQLQGLGDTRLGASQTFLMIFSKRFQSRSQRDINKDSFIHEWPETGLILFNSPSDPKPQIRIVDGRITELDGKTEAEFDLIDQFIARYAIDPSKAAQSMAMDSLAIARLLVDLQSRRQQVVGIFSGLTP